MKSDQQSSLLEVFQSEFTCPLSKKVIESPVISVEGYTYEKEALKNWLAQNKVEPQTKKSLTYVEEIPNHAFNALMTKVKTQIPRYELIFHQQNQTIHQLQEDFEEYKHEIQIEQELAQLEKNQEEPKQESKKQHFYKIKAIYKSIHLEKKMWHEKYLSKRKESKQYKSYGNLLKIRYQKKIQEQKLIFDQKQEEISKINDNLKEKNDHLQIYRGQMQKMQAQINSQKQKITNLEEASRQNEQKIDNLSSEKTKIIGKIKKGVKLINERLRINYLYERSLLEFIKTTVKKLNQSRPEGEIIQNDQIDQFISNQVLKIIHKLEEDKRQGKNETFNRFIGKVKNMIHEKSMTFHREKSFRLATGFDDEIDAEKCELGFEIIKIPYDEIIPMKDLLSMDWTGVHSILDSEVDEKRWRFFVDNFATLFKDVKKVKITNPILKEIKLEDLRKLSNLRLLKFLIDPNCPLKNQLTKLLNKSKESLSFVEII